MPETSPQLLHALLVGIDAYLPNPWCEPLHGAVADATAMEAFLQARGVPAENLVKLTASPGPDGSPAEPRDRRPTYDSIVGAIRRLGRAAARVGGELLVHYSGHGCRTPTLIPGSKGADGLDEGLVPYDVADSRARILRDVELSYLLEELKGVPVLLTLDACHSGGILRGEDALRVRGVDAIVRPPNGAVAPVELLEASWRRAHRRAYASLGPREPQVSRGAVPWIREVGPYVTLAAACRDREVAYEFPFDGEPRGALTYALLRVLGEGDAFPSWERLQRRVVHVLRRTGLHQTPVFEGNPSGVLLGLLKRGARRALRVIDLDPAKGRVMLDAGQASGISPGARLEILAEAGSVSVAEIEQSEASVSWARLLGRAPDERTAIKPGDKAFVTDPGSASRRRVLVVPPRETPAPSMSGRPPGWGVFRDGCLRDGPVGSPARWLEEVGYELEKRAGGFLEKVSSSSASADTAADFRITLDTQGRYEILHPDGRRVPHLPPLPAASPGAARSLVDRLVHLARFYQVRDLENGDTQSPLYGAVTAEVGRLAQGFVPGEPLEPEPCAEPLPRFTTDEGVCLTISNRSPRTLHLYVLALGRSWSVRLLHPRHGLETLPAGQAIRLPFRLSLPPGSPEGLEILKVIATTRPTNVRWLELPPISQTASLIDRTSLGVPADPLEEFFATLLRDGKPMRGTSGYGTSRDWGTDMVTFDLARSHDRTQSMLS